LVMGDFGNFGWLFQSGLDAFATAVISMGGKHEQVLDLAVGLAQAAPFFSLSWVLLNLIRGRPTDVALGVLVTSGIVFILLQKGVLEIPGRAPVTMSRGQIWAVEIIIPVYSKFAEIFRDADPKQSAVMIADLTEREIAPFSGSDLAALMRDFKKFCEPGPTDAAIPETTWQAVGLRGGGALGVPDSEVSVFSAATGERIRDRFVGWFPQIRMAQAVLDVREAGARRAEGIAALKGMSPERWPTGKQYLLPSEPGWQSRLSGGVDEAVDYLNPADVVGGALARSGVIEAGTVPDRYFVPENCYEAYEAAQHGAEEAYRALGDKIRPSSLAPNSEASVVAGVRAWSDVVNRSLTTIYQGEEGTLGSKSREMLADSLGAMNEAKGALATLDLAATLPYVVYGAAMGQAALILIFPIVALLSFFVGIEMLLYWLRLLVFTFLSLLFMEIVLSIVAGELAAISWMQAATAISSGGTPLDIEGIRGVLAAAAGFVIAASSYAAGMMLKIHAPNLAGGATSFSQLGSVAAGAVKTAVSGYKDVSAARTAGLKRQIMQQRLSNLQGGRSHCRQGGRGPAGSMSPQGSGGSTRIRIEGGVDLTPNYPGKRRPPRSGRPDSPMSPPPGGRSE
jgi:hypothetical protein